MKKQGLFTVKTLNLILVFFTALRVYGVPLDFYGTVTSSSDSNMISMTTDLLFTQIQTIPGYTVSDKRNQKYDPKKASDSTIAFYAEIQEGGNGSWICTINAIKADTDSNISLTKTYSSYYMILMDAKDSISNVLENLSNSSMPLTASNTSGTINADLENISGTWDCGNLIDKIVILRGGRGFVIFKNGASMNITLTVKGSKVLVTQSGRSNASFFPELSREVALKMATTAQPVTWELTLVDENTLKGVQNTLLPDPQSQNGATFGSKNVVWTRK